MALSAVLVIHDRGRKELAMDLEDILTLMTASIYAGYVSQKATIPVGSDAMRLRARARQEAKHIWDERNDDKPPQNITLHAMRLDTQDRQGPKP